jgi:hypothetical protein
MMPGRKRPFGKWDLVPVLAGLLVLGAVIWFQREAASPERRARRLLAELRQPRRIPGTPQEWLDEMQRRRDGKHRTPGSVVRDLIELGPAGAGPVIEALRNRREKLSVRMAAARVLGVTGPAEGAVPALAEALRAPVTALRGEAGQALGRLGRAAAQAIPALEAARHDEDGGVRAAAADALGRIRPPPVATEPGTAG